jgi:hypothetical protein
VLWCVLPWPVTLDASATGVGSVTLKQTSGSRYFETASGSTLTAIGIAFVGGNVSAGAADFLVGDAWPCGVRGAHEMP